MVEDKKEVYLKQLEDIKRKSRFKKARIIYKGHKTKKESSTYSPWEEGKRHLREKEIDSIETAALAYSLMQMGVERGDVHYSFLGAQLYEKIGKGGKAIPRLLKATEIGVKKGYVVGSELENAYSQIKAFIEKNIGERQQGGGALEKKFGIFVAFIIGGIAISLGSLTITGNAVSNLTQTTPGLLGIILFLAGLVGMFFYFRGK